MPTALQAPFFSLQYTENTLKSVQQKKIEQKRIVDKTQVRSYTRAARARLAALPAWHRTLSQKVGLRLLASHFWKQAQAIMLYTAVRGEVQTEFLLAKAYEQGKRVFLPRCEGEQGNMVACPFEKGHSLVKGRYAIPEPISAAEEVQFAPLLVLVPGLAFDRMGHRLGMGGGYYDRFLASHPLATPCGLCFSRQLFSSLPFDPWDIPMAAVCTEREFLVFHP